MKKPRPATIEPFEKMLYLYRFAVSEQKEYAIGSPEWLNLSRSRSNLYNDMMFLAGLSATRLDSIIIGETTWQELWEDKHESNIV